MDEEDKEVVPDADIDVGEAVYNSSSTYFSQIIVVGS